MQSSTNGTTPGASVLDCYGNTPEPNADKAFATLATQFAVAGHALIRSNPADGAAAFYAMRWGMMKVLPTLDAAHTFLMQLGGAR